jgi:3,4-dihydroxy 2-butanone 4-phosphate synthase/GTP cyclohydrolase II
MPSANHRIADPTRFAHVVAAIEAIAAGKMVILVDDEDRENEGDLVLAADKVTPEAINFMATHARGLICLAMEESIVDRLELPMMVQHNSAPLGTAFTVSIEARSGVSTGISAADRSHTIKVAIDPATRPRDLVSPGHVFPLRARPGGVLQRTGQTEGSVDLARLAGCTSAGVICEIMNDDGSMARMPDLERFAEKHGLLILSIADLIQYRLQHEALVRRIRDVSVVLDRTNPNAHTWRSVVYGTDVDPRQFLALVFGDVTSSGTPVLTRVHTGSTFGDVFGSTPFEGGSNLRAAIAQIEREGRGVILYLPGRGDVARELDDYVKAHLPREATDAPPEPPLREFGIGAQCLADLGLRQIRLLTNNPRKIAGLHGYGLDVVACVPLKV